MVRAKLTVNSSKVGLVILFLCAIGATSTLAHGQEYCNEIGFMAGGKIQVNGFSIEAKAISDPKAPGYTICHVSITSPQGKIVYETNDSSFEFDPITGKDVNGDGQPDAVIVGYSGGAHCCWVYDIISLGKTPGLIGEFTNRAPATFSDLGGNSQIEISIWDGSFDEGFWLDHGSSVFPKLIVQLKGGHFEDVGPEFWPIFEKDIDKKRGELTAQSLRAFLHSNPYQVHDSSDYQATKRDILTIALDYLYGGKPQEAKATLSTLWPAASQARTWKEMLHGYCSGLRTQFRFDLGPACRK